MTRARPALRRFRLTTLALTLLAAVGLPGTAFAQEEPDPAAVPKGVVSFIDTGINPYHDEFEWDSPLAYQHPSTYLPGYPADAEALPITLDLPNWNQAVQRDCNSIWRNVVPKKLYWFPGTKIVGAYSVSPSWTPNCSSIHSVANSTEILDYNGHGTMVASRGAANTYGACRECLIVSVQDPLTINLLNPSADTTRVISAIKFAGDNASWIDAQSNSWGPYVFPGWDPTGTTGLFTASPALVRAVEEVSQAHLAFWASGNGVAGRGGVLGSPTLVTPTLTPSAISVGGMDSGYVNVWPGFPPHVVSDSCNAWAAHRNSTNTSADNVAGGTSGATPFAAGGAGRILFEARSILGDFRTGVRSGGVVAEGPAGLVPSGPIADGVLTLAELKTLTFKTATARPERQFEDGSVCGAGLYGPIPVLWKDVPPEYPEFIHIGYGAVDTPAREVAFKVLRGEQAMPDRSRTDAYFAADDTARRALHQVYRGV